MALIDWFIYFASAALGGGLLFLIIVIFWSGMCSPHRYKDLDR